MITPKLNRTVHAFNIQPKTSVSCALVIALILVGNTLAAEAETDAETRTSNVGINVQLKQQVLPGTLIEAAPLNDKSPVVLRIIETFPHGSDFRYDLEYYGLDPGEYDLRNFMRRADGSSVDDLPAMPIKIESVLAEGQVRPNPISSNATPRVGGYFWQMIGAGIVWLVVLLWLLFGGRKKRAAEIAASRQPVTLAERLRPMIDRAVAGEMDQREHSELEMMLVSFWRKRLNMEQIPVAESLRKLRDHDEAGPLLRQIEDWLHRPAGGNQDVDVAELLKPYQERSS